MACLSLTPSLTDATIYWSDSILSSQSSTHVIRIIRFNKQRNNDPFFSEMQTYMITWCAIQLNHSCCARKQNAEKMHMFFTSERCRYTYQKFHKRFEAAKQTTATPFYSVNSVCHDQVLRLFKIVNLHYNRKLRLRQKQDFLRGESGGLVAYPVRKKCWNTRMITLLYRRSISPVAILAEETVFL